MSKFASIEDELLYQYSLDGGADDEQGSVDELGWYGKFWGLECPPFPKQGAIMKEDGQGFVSVDWYDDREALDVEWGLVEDEYADYMVE